MNLSTVIYLESFKKYQFSQYPPFNGLTLLASISLIGFLEKQKIGLCQKTKYSKESQNGYFILKICPFSNLMYLYVVPKNARTD